MFKFLKKDKSNKAAPEQVPQEEPARPAAPADESAVRQPAGADVSHDESSTSPRPTNPEPTIPAPTPEPATDSNQPNPAPLAGKLKKSRGSFGDRLKSLFSLRKQIDDDLVEDIETLLLTADVGAAATMQIIDNLTQRIKRKELGDGDAVWNSLRNELAELVEPVEQPLVVNSATTPFVILVVGVNGVGKTTTIGKLARKFKEDGKQVMLAAGDTFRAAAVEQLQTWGKRNDVPVVAQATGADSASVIFDALQSAQAKGVDILIADTAGRLHTQANLMDELAKIKRVMSKLDAAAPHETMLVIDGGTGQNALSQAEQFHQAVGLTGLTVTKLDGTAKGGVLFALAKNLGVPIRFIGVGESAVDLRPFEARSFVAAVLGDQPG